MSTLFTPRISVEQIEEGAALAPKFDQDGLIPAICTDSSTGDVLMLGYMNAQALELTITTGFAHYFSRSRQVLWKKGETSGLTQKIVDLRIDDDQDTIWLKVQVDGSGASCHVGYMSCFYRQIPIGTSNQNIQLNFIEQEKTFDPKKVYGDAPNPTKI